MRYVLAVDIGASGGRHILGHLSEGRICLEEIYRFDNRTADRDGHQCWRLDRLFSEILKGMQKCAALGKIPESVGIDTWGVDYVLLDQDGRILGDTISYRDGRTAAWPEKLAETLSPEALYHRTGIALHPFNTIYQLLATDPALKRWAADFLLLPDYFNFLLTGVKVCEYTNASTTALLSPETGAWDKDLLALTETPAGAFHAPVMPGTSLGALLPEIAQQVGFTCQVVLPPTHDTGAAFLAVPAFEGEKAVYLSSGTWSLLGVERDAPILTEAARLAGFTNEGGYGGSIRFLKNISGMWILQCIRNELEKRYTFAEMAQMAAQGEDVPWRVNVTDDRFLSPGSMLSELQCAVVEQGGDALTLPQMLRMVNVSLAESYAASITQLEEITGEHYDTIHIMGGGCLNETLNQLTADKTGRRVVAGPTEGSALGNVMAQLIALGDFIDLEDARRAERESFAVKEYGAQCAPAHCRQG